MTKIEFHDGPLGGQVYEVEGEVGDVLPVDGDVLEAATRSSADSEGPAPEEVLKRSDLRPVAIGEYVRTLKETDDGAVVYVWLGMTFKEFALRLVAKSIGRALVDGVKRAEAREVMDAVEVPDALPAEDDPIWGGD